MYVEILKQGESSYNSSSNISSSWNKKLCHTTIEEIKGWVFLIKNEHRNEYANQVYIFNYNLTKFF